MQEIIPRVSFSSSGTSRKPKCVVRDVLGPARDGSSSRPVELGRTFRNAAEVLNRLDDWTKAAWPIARSDLERAAIVCR